MAGKAVIIVAGGKGSRFGSQTPKQYLLLKNKPVYIHTIERFITYDNEIQVVLVLPSQTSIEEIEKIHEEVFSFLKTKISITLGGKTRFESVKNGLKAIDSSISIVGVHDAVRPLVSAKVIKTCYEAAKLYGNAIPTIDLTNSLRKLKGNGSVSVNRQEYKIVQTPQCFSIKQINKAYEQAYREEFTDDASVVEAVGYKIKMVEGNRENIKITTPPDLSYAELLLK